MLRLTKLLILSLITTFGYSMLPSNALLAQQTNEYYYYEVKAGDTPYSIAKKSNMSLDEFYTLNPDAKENGLKPGQQLQVKAEKVQQKITHQVQQGETLYGIARKYGVSTDDIKKQNPAIDSNNTLRVGQELTITHTEYQPPTALFATTTTVPDSVRTHVVEKKETVYGIAHRYGLSTTKLLELNPEIANGLQPGMTLIVGVKTKRTLAADVPAKRVIAEQEKPVVKNEAAPVATKQPALKDEPALPAVSEVKMSNIRIGALMPLTGENGQRNDNFVEFYEGLLMAITDAQSPQCSLEIFGYDITSLDDEAKLKTLLAKNEMTSFDIIIGGFTGKQISAIAQFANRWGITYIVPFPNQSDVANNNSNIYQLHQQMNILSYKSARAFANRYKNCNVIFLSEGLQRPNLFNLITANLSELGVTPIETAPKLNDIVKNLSLSKYNVLLPANNSAATLTQVLTIVKQIAAQKKDYKITLFGYPDWQTYDALEADLHTFNASFFTPFYADQLTMESFDKRFAEKYKGQTINDIAPCYALLGYDAGFYFVAALKQWGKDLNSALNKVDYQPLQSPYFFRRTSPVSGYFNEGLYIVEYLENGTVRKIDVSKE